MSGVSGEPRKAQVGYVGTCFWDWEKKKTLWGVRCGRRGRGGTLTARKRRPGQCLPS